MNDPDNKFPAASPVKPVSPELAALIEKMEPATLDDIECQRDGAARYTPGERQAYAPRRPYVSIDIETTGLDPETCQILEVGAVIDDWVTPLEALPVFQCYINHKQISGEPFALAMNAEILAKIAKERKCPRTYLSPREVSHKLCEWIYCHRLKPPIVFAGKNVQGFDIPFLKKLLDFSETIKLHHRVIDPCMLFFNPDTDQFPPSSKECMERAGIPGEVAHDAVADAKAVVQMIRAAFPQSPTPVVKQSARELAKQLTEQFHRNGQFTAAHRK